jgi:hypothetical protein
MTSNWDFAAIQRCITDEVQEHVSLDYKAAGALAKSDGKRSEITKDVSAMANAAGGVIIYGIAEYADPNKKHLPERIDPVDQRLFSKEWLEQIIQTIRPRIDGVIIHPVPISGQPDHVVYVVEIPQSTTAHQATDRRYYKRFNFQSVPMEDYEIRDVMGRTQHPTVTLAFRIYKRKLWFIERTKLVITAQNDGDVLAEHVNAVFFLPPSLYAHKPIVFQNDMELRDGVRYLLVRFSNTERDVLEEDDAGKQKLGSSWFAPILPRARHIWNWELPRQFSQDRLYLDEQIHWKIFADNAPVRMDSLALQDVPWVVEHGQKRAAGRALFGQSRMMVYLVLFLILLILWLAPMLYRIVRSGL